MMVDMPPPQQWTTQDTVLQVAAVSLTLADFSQTFKFTQAKDPSIAESNPLLGPTPSRGRLRAYMVGTMAVVSLVPLAIPRPYRTIFQSIVIGVGIGALTNNLGNGVGFAIPW